MAKRFFVLAALVAMVLAVAAPMALAHGGQEGVVGPQPVQWTGEGATITGLLEPGVEKLDGTPTWQMEDETAGGFYHVEEGEGVDLASFEGQKVSLHGELGHLEGAVILVDSVEPLAEETAAEAQYEPQEAFGEEFAGTGVVEYLDDKADGTPVYGLSVSPEEGHYMEGDFDFAAFEGETVSVTGQFVLVPGGGSYLQVQSIERAGVESGEEVSAGEEAVPTGSPSPVEVTVDGGEEVAPVEAPETTTIQDEVAEETVAIELASEETPAGPSGDAAEEPGILSVAAKALPTTGGLALLLPLAGLVLAAAGLAAFRMTR
ncbi:hypothetical protein GBA65_20730 [Rubrobacter marinus]|uniref:Gram-positive cocci surface proteins LPxTG domain-containing protein n=1 Tax=Rubrobacter marinus TaxID=2653852 RepID=A0A6G8Q228_9ACTN|nr:hypothetical protein [Rubrobacter marinus]QIN80532.1 hypothetical protein GBA65_20730 [Rubrobacter marinus]